MSKVYAKDFVEECYTNYARFVNSFRALPDSRDGLKLVQRRILSTLIKVGNHGHLIPTSSIVGDCNKWFHPHGETSIVGAAYNLVNDSLPYLTGKGNFGYRGLRSAPAAAQRYTKLGLSERAIKYLVPLFKYSDYFLNENEFQEPVFLPTALPYCLLNGCIGIGIGCVTNIPPILEEDLLSSVKSLLEGKIPLPVRPISLGGGIVEIDQANLDKLNQKGEATFRVKAKITKVYDSSMSHDVFEITDVPNFVNLSKLYVVFRNELIDKLVFIRDESQKQIKVIVGRTKRIRKVTDADILSSLQRVCSRTLSVRCYVSHNGAARVMTPNQIVESSLTLAVKINERLVNDQISKVSDKILFEKVKHALAKMIIDGNESDVIKTTLSLSNDQFDSFTEKSISTLRANQKDTTKLEADMLGLSSELVDLKMSFGKKFGFL